jgi:hypothetical protein
MLTYYIIYKSETDRTPAGIIVRGRGGVDALIWNHRLGAWQYNPRTAVDFLGNDENWDSYEAVPREVAERVAPQVTGGEELPDEDTIRWIFQWKGEPPQREDD